LPSQAFFKFGFGFSPYDTTRKVCGLAEQHNATSPFSRICVVVSVSLLRQSMWTSGPLRHLSISQMPSPDDEDRNRIVKGFVDKTAHDRVEQ
jgi:hypothetical protein